MFFTAVDVQFAARKWPVARVFAASALATILSMICVVLAIHASLVSALIASALLDGTGHGFGQSGGLTPIGLHVPDTHRAKANAVISIGGYIPAGPLPVATGYLIDRVGLASAGTSFALMLAVTAPVGGTLALRRAEQHDA